MSDIGPVLNNIARAVWDATRELGYAPECCIAATAAARRLVRSAGYTSDPVPVSALAANAAAAPLISSSVPMSQWPAEAWSIGVHPDATAPMRADVAARVRGREYGGHLLLQVRTSEGLWLLDASAAQFDRPERDLHVGPLAAPVGWQWEQGGMAVFESSDGSNLVYETLATPQRDFRNAVDWQPERVKRLANTARRHLT